ncbi:hypothetical protein [Lacibacter sp.]|uniref:hypothetical protein n=1 Tax=Lacibacter sp. TaxID=1915409 RepID=UPI002B4B3ECE|nr:hypothetical protein [Lacibacter sp.]HLP37647.1 hypothetical protein [Lacibacter sp.]
MENELKQILNIHFVRRIVITLFVFCSVHFLFAQKTTEDKDRETITIVTNTSPSKPVQFGIEKLKQSLQAKGFIVQQNNKYRPAVDGKQIIVGVQDNKFLSSFNSKLYQVPESLLIRKVPGNTLLAVGYDPAGAMYALLELAEQIEAVPDGADFYKVMKESIERPFCTERSLSTYINSQHVRNGFFHDPLYWETLFEQLARSRINSYDLIFKYKAPIYTLFFELPQWPSKNTGGIVISADEQQRNLKALQNIVQSAHDHGIKITLGIWNHVSNPDDAERLSDYTEAAIKKIVELVPFDAFQFRMHWESGLPRDMTTLTKFWGSVFDGIHHSGRNIKFYPRAKGLPDTIINLGLNKGLRFAIETKFSAEQMGMPFHPAHIQKANQTDRRHGYADLLSYPKEYDILYRVWNGGSQKLLVWGDADWARRFALNSKLYNPSGLFEFMEIEGAEPMGNGSQQALTQNYQYTRYEFQRYWCQNLMIGRMGYNPQTKNEIFIRAFQKHYGYTIANDMVQALAYSSKIIPRIISSAMPDFQEQRGVPEWGSGSGLNGKGTLAAYAKVLPLDIQTFASFAEEANAILQQKPTAKYRPLHNAAWYQRTSDSINRYIRKIENQPNAKLNKETIVTLLDMKILAGIASFHAERIKAAVAYQMYLQLDRSAKALDSAIHYEAKALKEYEKIVQIAGDVYRKDLDMTVSDANHWAAEFELLKKAFKELKKSPVNNQTAIPSLVYPNISKTVVPKVRHQSISKLFPDTDLRITATITSQADISTARVLYRGLTQFQDYQTIEMKRNGDVFTAFVPAAAVNDVIEYNKNTGALWDFMYLIEVIDQNGNGMIYPDFEKTDPYIIATVPHKTIRETNGLKTRSKIADITYTSNNDLGAFRIEYPLNGDVFSEGAEIRVKVHTPQTDPNEKVELFNGKEKIDAIEIKKNEFIIRGLKNGSYKINAHITAKGLITWAEAVEIVIGERSKQ